MSTIVLQPSELVSQHQIRPFNGTPDPGSVPKINWSRVNLSGTGTYDDILNRLINRDGLDPKAMLIYQHGTMFGRLKKHAHSCDREDEGSSQDGQFGRDYERYC